MIMALETKTQASFVNTLTLPLDRRRIEHAMEEGKVCYCHSVALGL